LIMALSGVVLLLFVVGHLVGNLTIFVAPSVLNSYAHWLQQSVMLWPFRLMMLFFLGLHIVMGATLAYENRQAATQGSACHHWWQRLFYNHHMVWSGIAVLLFLLFHLGHLTLGVGASESFYQVDQQQVLDIYGRVVSGFQIPWITTSYIFFMLLVGLHLNHVVRGLLQTLGFYHENYFGLLRLFSIALSLLLTAGFISIPLTVLFGGLN